MTEVHDMHNRTKIIITSVLLSVVFVGILLFGFLRQKSSGRINAIANVAPNQSNSAGNQSGSTIDLAVHKVITAAERERLKSTREYVDRCYRDALDIINISPQDKEKLLILLTERSLSSMDAGL
jgi:hypothetical protein